MGGEELRDAERTDAVTRGPDAGCGTDGTDETHGGPEETLPVAVTEPEYTEDQLRLFPELRHMVEADKQLDLDLEGLPPEAPLPLPLRFFIQHYITNGFRGGPAVLAAGITTNPNVASVYAHRYLRRPAVQAEMANQLRELIADGRLSRDALLIRLRSIIHANPADFFDTDPDGGLTLRDLSELTPEQAAAIKKLQVNTTHRKGGEKQSTVNVELLDPMRAIELAAKMLEIIGDKLDVTSAGEPIKTGAPMEIIVRREPQGIAIEGKPDAG